jgi:hypothetical protein
VRRGYRSPRMSISGWCDCADRLSESAKPIISTTSTDGCLISSSTPIERQALSIGTLRNDLALNAEPHDSRSMTTTVKRIRRFYIAIDPHHVPANHAACSYTGPDLLVLKAASSHSAPCPALHL